MSKDFNRYRMNNLSTKNGRAGVGVPVEGLSATANGANAMDLAWTNPGTADDVVMIERSSPDNSSYAFLAYVDAADEAYADSGLTAATAYFYRVTLLDKPATAGSPEANDTTTA